MKKRKREGEDEEEQGEKSPTRASSRVAAKGRKVYKEDPSGEEEEEGELFHDAVSRTEEMPAIADTDICPLAPPMKTNAKDDAVTMASEEQQGGVAEGADANNNDSLTAEI